MSTKVIDFSTKKPIKQEEKEDSSSSKTEKYHDLLVEKYGSILAAPLRERAVLVAMYTSEIHEIAYAILTATMRVIEVDHTSLMGLDPTTTANQLRTDEYLMQEITKIKERAELIASQFMDSEEEFKMNLENYSDKMAILHRKKMKLIEGKGDEENDNPT